MGFMTIELWLLAGTTFGLMLVTAALVLMCLWSGQTIKHQATTHNTPVDRGARLRPPAARHGNVHDAQASVRVSHQRQVPK
jgi:hypothetical protein